MRWLCLLAGMTVCAASVRAGPYDWPQGVPFQAGSSETGWGETRFDDPGPDYGSHPGYRERPRDADPGNRYGYRRDPDGGGGASTPGLPAYARDAPSQGYWSGDPWDEKPRQPQGFDPGAYQGARGAAEHRSGYSDRGYSFQGDSRAQETAVRGYRFRGDPVPQSGYQGTPYFDGQYHYRPLSQAERDRSGQGAGWRPLPPRRQDPPSLDGAPGAAFGFEPALGYGE